MRITLFLLVGLFASFVRSPVCWADSALPKVGVIVPLTGPVANWGRSIQLGIQFGVERLGTRVQFVFEDEGACDSKQALTAAQKLLAIDRVSLLLTGCLNGTRAILPLARSSQTLVVSLGLVSEAMAHEERDLLLTPSASITAEADGLSKLLKADGRRKLALVRVEDNFTEEIVSGLRRYSERDGWELVLDERLTFDTYDFRPSLMKIARSGADAVLVYTSTQQAVSAFRQLKQLRIQTLGTYGGYVIEADPPPSSDMTALDGVRFVAAVTPVEDDLSRFLATHSSKETFQTRVGADVVADLTKAFSSCSGKQFGAPCFRDVLVSRTEKLPAYSGGFSYDKNGLARRTIRAKMVDAGRYRWIEPMA